MAPRFASGAASAALRWLLVLQVVAIAAGVSVPATAADDPAWRSERGGRERRSEKREGQGEKKERRRAPERDGERGHVRRRGDLVERSTHVEKKEGWRRID